MQSTVGRVGPWARAWITAQDHVGRVGEESVEEVADKLRPRRRVGASGPGSVWSLEVRQAEARIRI